MVEATPPTPASASAPVPSPPPTVPGRRGIGLRVALTSIVALLVLVIGIAAAGWWAVRSERGSAWLLSVVPGVQAEGVQGRLLGDFSARRVVVSLPGGGDTVTLSALAWRGLRIERTRSAAWARVVIDSLEAARVEVVTAPRPNAERSPAPTDLRLPVELDLRSLRIAELQATPLGEAPIRALAARIRLGANDGAEHRVDDLTLRREQLAASGNLRIATTAPLALDARLGLAQEGGSALPAWNASVTLAGPLESPALQATLRAEPSPNRPAQSLDARAVLRPFAAWPLAELEATTTALDLSAFAGTAPTTALTARATATSTAADRPANVSLEVSNALAGRWNESRLPLRRLVVELGLRPDRPSDLELRAFTAELGTAAAPAGRITGEGGWSLERWNLAAQLVALRPSLLDARGPAMELSGPLAMAGGPTAETAVEIQTTLTGNLPGRGPARNVELKLDASAQPRRLLLREFRASAGGARATVDGLLTQSAANAPWAAEARVALVDFDPAVWWPGNDDSPWRRAVTRLDATATAALTVPAAAVQQPLTDALAAVRGEAAVALRKSVLAGVPISGSAHFRSSGESQVVADLRLDADGNSVRAQGTVATAGNGASDTWEIQVEGGALARLAPLFRLAQPAGADATLAGTLTGSARVNGRWPALSTRGALDANGLRVGALSVQQARATWTLGTSATAPVEANVTIDRAALSPGGVPGPSVETLKLLLTGTGRSHALTLKAESKVRPPAWAETLQPGAARTDASRTVAVLEAEGGVVDLPDAAFAGWRGAVRQLDVRGDSPGSAPLLRAANLAFEAFWGGGLPRASMQPGRFEALGGAVRWSRLAWQAKSRPDGFAQIEADAEIEPFRIAPVLARAQPDFGWGGDLTIAGRVKLRSAPTFAADAVIERSKGDLTVTDELGTRPLGLTDLRFGLVAENGTWSFTQGLAGRTLGVIAGAEVVRTSPQATWPSPDSPLDGVLQLRVDDLGTWGNWVPPGWRLGGSVNANARFGGRFGAPEYTGSIEGRQLAVRNFLEGVNVTDGDMAISLRGSTARIDRFTARAGAGTLRLEGEASLGEAPKATVSIKAERFQLLGRVDRRIVTSGAGQLQLDKSRLAFTGKFGVDEGLIDFTRGDAPTLGNDVTVVRASGTPSPAAAASAAAAPAGPPSVSANPPRAVALDLGVTLGEKLRIRGRGLDAGLRGELQISSPDGRLAIDGTVRVVDGTYAAYGQKLAIDRGLISFAGGVENPRLDIQATRPDIDIRVGVVITGTPANLRVRLFSEPELSEIDKLSWLVMGRASEGLGRNDTALLQRAALGLLAGEGGGAGGPTDQLTKALGLDDISVRQTDGEVRDTVIGLGKQLSKRVYVGYERGLNATTGSFQLIYRIAQRFTLRAQSGDDNSLDLIWTLRWR